MKKKPTLTIFIPAYNAEGNIASLLRALVSQKYKKFMLAHIIVLSDQSEDGTIEHAKTVHHPKIHIRSNKIRRGFAYGVKKILMESTTDIVVVLNDDILIRDTQIIEKLCTPFLTNTKLGLVGGNVQSLPSRNFIQQTAQVGLLLYKRFYSAMPSVHSKWTCDGKVFAVSKKMYKGMKYPKNLGDMGNVDSYVYFRCLLGGFTYNFVPKATVYFPHVSTLGDFVKLSLRNTLSARTIQRTFGDLAKREYAKSRRFYEFLSPREFLLYFPHLVLLLGVQYWVRLFSAVKTKRFTPTWSSVESTKKIRLI